MKLIGDGGVEISSVLSPNNGIFLYQQAELEEALQPLEASLSASGQTVDSERERTYALAESLDGQLARMCGDLKEVASNDNETQEKAGNGFS